MKLTNQQTLTLELTSNEAISLRAIINYAREDMTKEERKFKYVLSLELDAVLPEMVTPDE